MGVWKDTCDPSKLEFLEEGVRGWAVGVGNIDFKWHEVERVKAVLSRSRLEIKLLGTDKVIGIPYAMEQFTPFAEALSEKMAYPPVEGIDGGESRFGPDVLYFVVYLLIAVIGALGVSHFDGKFEATSPACLTWGMGLICFCLHAFKSVRAVRVKAGELSVATLMTRSTIAYARVEDIRLESQRGQKGSWSIFVVYALRGGKEVRIGAVRNLFDLYVVGRRRLEIYRGRRPRSLAKGDRRRSA